MSGKLLWRSQQFSSEISNILKWQPYSFIFEQTFKFRTVLGSQNYYKDITDFHTLQDQFSNYSNLVSSSYISIIHLSQLMNQHWYIVINISPYIIQIFSLFKKSPFCSKIPFGIPNYIYLSSFLRFIFDHGIWSHYFMANKWGNSGNNDRLYFLRLQNHCRWRLQP